MHAIIRIDMDNDAFGDYPGDELAQILRKLASRMDGSVVYPLDDFSLQDSNGNRVGHCQIKEGKDPTEWR